MKLRRTTTRSASGDSSSLTAASAEIINRVEALASQKGWTMGQVSLAWMLKRVTSPVIGFSSVDRIDDALSARGKELSEQEEKHLEEAYAPLEIEGHF